MAPERSVMFLSAKVFARAARAACAAGGRFVGEIRIRIELSHHGVTVIVMALVLPPEKPLLSIEASMVEVA
eukprot:4137090-Prymnesium_polylepis.1